MPGMGGPPPPPPPPMPGMGGPPPPPPMPGMGGPPPPPPMMGGGLPPPVRAGPRKPEIKPKSQMKPLYWTRIQMLPNQFLAPQPNQDKDSKILWDELDEVKMEMNEFDELFSKSAPKKREKKDEKKTEEAKPNKNKPTTMLDAKRSQNLGILIKSKGLEIGQIEDSVYNCEDSIPLDVLEAIREAQGTKDELDAIKGYLQSGQEAPLDAPDQFLLDLSAISFFSDRLICLTFQSKFADSVQDVETRLNNIKSVLEFITGNQHLKQIFAVILTCGNYLNGGNKQRGQADGFNLDILPKLKDLKSKDNSTNLLAYIVYVCIEKYDDKKGTPEAVLHVPDPGDVEKCIHIDFDKIQADIEKTRKDLEITVKKSGMIVEKSEEDKKEPFKSKMAAFILKAEGEISELSDLLQDCINKFRMCMAFYKWTPKKGKMEDAKPEDFFVNFHLFCDDYKNIWKKEQIKVQKELIKLERQKYLKHKESMKNVEKKKTSAGGLKSKLQKRKSRTSAANSPRPMEAADETSNSAAASDVIKENK